jgi:hypothetical protein
MNEETKEHIYEAVLSDATYVVYTATTANRMQEFTVIFCAVADNTIAAYSCKL